MSEEFSCFFAGRDDAGPCQGFLIRGHLLPRQLLRREFPHGVVEDGGRWWALKRGEERHDLPFRSLDDLIRDERGWLPMCGGIMGDGAHHGAFDTSRKLRIAREELPAAFLEYADEIGLSWWVERTYRSRQPA